MQLLLESRADDFAAWKAAFDAEAENIDNSGLNTLQIWKGDGGAVLVLFEVINRPRAEEWLTKQAALGRSQTARFLQTA